MKLTETTILTAVLIALSAALSMMIFAVAELQRLDNRDKRWREVRRPQPGLAEQEAELHGEWMNGDAR